MAAQSALLEGAGSAIHNDRIGPLSHGLRIEAHTKPNIAGPSEFDDGYSLAVILLEDHCHVQLRKFLSADGGHCDYLWHA